MCAQHDHAALPVPSLASTDELAAAMAALPNPVFVFKPVRDPEGAVVELTYTFMNEAAGRLYGKSVDEVLGRGQRELFPSVSELGIWDAYLGVLETGLPVSFDVPWFHENGVQGSFRLAVHRFGDGILVSAHDITEQVKAERALEEDRAVLRATLDSLLDPSVRFEAVRDEIGQITDFVYADANPAACAYHNMAYEDLVGTHLLDLLPGVATTGLLTLYEHIVESGEALALDDYPYATEFLGGEERRYDIRAARVRDG